MTATDSRTPREVLEDHLAQALRGQVEEDLARNYSEDIVLLTGEGIYHGRSGLLELADRLFRVLPEADFHYRTQLVVGELGFLEWSGRSVVTGHRVRDGTDTFLIRNGRIVAQTIHYTVEFIARR